MSNNKQLVEQRTGQVALREDIFTQEQLQLFKDIIVIADKNPILQWKDGDPNHNRDFCIIKGKIEPVKEFCLKVQHQAGLSMANTSREVYGAGVDAQVICTVKVWGEQDRSVELSGASSARECGATWSKPNARAFHDAVGRAQTRAFKTALEAYMGFPFINFMLQTLFGGFEVEGNSDDPRDHGIKDVTETGSDHKVEDAVDPNVAKFTGTAYRWLDYGVKKAGKDEEWREGWLSRIKAAPNAGKVAEIIDNIQLEVGHANG